jgi:hypothetical protein
MIRGSLVALVTPMTDDGAVDQVALERLVEWHIAEGTDAIVAVVSQRPWMRRSTVIRSVVWLRSLTVVFL